jgi:hypothetical protein
MQHKYALRTLDFSLWLTLGCLLPGIALADDFDDAVSALADGDDWTAYRGFKRQAPDEQEAMKWVELATKLVERNSDEADEGCE